MRVVEARRSVLKMTQAQFAKHIGVSTRTYIRYEQDPPKWLRLLLGYMINHRAKHTDQRTAT